MKKFVLVIFLILFFFILFSYKLYLEPKRWENKFLSLRKNGLVKVSDYINELGTPDIIKMDTLYNDDSYTNNEEYYIGYWYIYNFWNIYEYKRTKRLFILGDSIVGYGF